MSELKRTGLYDLHLELGGKIVPFAGWELPVQYPMGVMKEHLHTRAAAGLFDVSHMGQVILRCPPKALEALVPVDVAGLAEGRQRYGLFTDDTGGILDDLMIANRGDHLFLVVNAAMADQDIAHLRAHLGNAVEPVTDRALLALQGPKAASYLAQIAPPVAQMRFMDVAVIPTVHGVLWISRSGYTGEDGFEISVPTANADGFARALLAMEDVAPIGLGARDSLRLEAGLCLYGSDIDSTTTPVEADLNWAIQKSRRTERTDFPGAAVILDQITNGAPRKRVGLLPEGRAPMRAGTNLFASADAADPIGTITSGAFGPSIERPMSMGYLPADLAAPGTTVFGEVRGKRLPATVTPLPFRPATYKR
ncbi:glycine cleavage system aminomethyltransferase GcvT [Maritimibacter sp. UBA3975]|uniref:glycine cleavage system aminomethyltransferase GcvT n=1 Tax=Maritimibacter sp. UBA3975 TaxID=1946833 RepID=UPI000C0B33D6|nr:glycine cleavage system aminomethyltransferase GcvT [Maritimibacter sp. UBA3975]MAM60415.1 glycine cleavage system protein T [Maritimibacter sp.]|tara:strand:+ start:1966 stop:3060 length:1095 start_codon:yes stop_codon:yes gene_type:complete